MILIYSISTVDIKSLAWHSNVYHFHYVYMALLIHHSTSINIMLLLRMILSVMISETDIFRFGSHQM